MKNILETLLNNYNVNLREEYEAVLGALSNFSIGEIDKSLFVLKSYDIIDSIERVSESSVIEYVTDLVSLIGNGNFGLLKLVITTILGKQFNQNKPLLVINNDNEVIIPKCSFIPIKMKLNASSNDYQIYYLYTSEDIIVYQPNEYASLGLYISTSLSFIDGKAVLNILQTTTPVNDESNLFVGYTNNVYEKKTLLWNVNNTFENKIEKYNTNSTLSFLSGISISGCVQFNDYIVNVTPFLDNNNTTIETLTEEEYKHILTNRSISEYLDKTKNYLVNKVVDYNAIPLLTCSTTFNSDFGGYILSNFENFDIVLNEFISENVINFKVGDTVFSTNDLKEIIYFNNEKNVESDAVIHEMLINTNVDKIQNKKETFSDTPLLITKTPDFLEDLCLTVKSNSEFTNSGDKTHNNLVYTLGLDRYIAYVKDICFVNDGKLDTTITNYKKQINFSGLDDLDIEEYDLILVNDTRVEEGFNAKIYIKSKSSLRILKGFTGLVVDYLTNDYLTLVDENENDFSFSENVTEVLSSNEITVDVSRYFVGQTIVFYNDGGSVPSGITLDEELYYVSAVNTSTITISKIDNTSLTIGTGSAFNFYIDSTPRRAFNNVISTSDVILDFENVTNVSSNQITVLDESVYVVNNLVRVYGETLPPELSEGDYYVQSTGTNYITLTDSYSGTVITLTDGTYDFNLEVHTEFISTMGSNNQITVSNVSDFYIGQSIQFISETSLPAELIEDYSYYVAEITGSTLTIVDLNDETLNITSGSYGFYIDYTPLTSYAIILSDLIFDLIIDNYTNFYFCYDNDYYGRLSFNEEFVNKNIAYIFNKSDKNLYKTIGSNNYFTLEKVENFTDDLLLHLKLNYPDIYEIVNTVSLSDDYYLKLNKSLRSYTIDVVSLQDGEMYVHLQNDGLFSNGDTCYLLTPDLTESGMDFIKKGLPKWRIDEFTINGTIDYNESYSINSVDNVVEEVTEVATNYIVVSGDYSLNDTVYISGLDLPTELKNTFYYVVNISGSTLYLSETIDGEPLSYTAGTYNFTINNVQNGYFLSQNYNLTKFLGTIPVSDSYDSFVDDDGVSITKYLNFVESGNEYKKPYDYKIKASDVTYNVTTIVEDTGKTKILLSGATLNVNDKLYISGSVKPLSLPTGYYNVESYDGTYLTVSYTIDGDAISLTTGVSYNFTIENVEGLNVFYNTEGERIDFSNEFNNNNRFLNTDTFVISLDYDEKYEPTEKEMLHSNQKSLSAIVRDNYYQLEDGKTYIINNLILKPINNNYVSSSVINDNFYFEWEGRYYIIKEIRQKMYYKFRTEDAIIYEMGNIFKAGGYYLFNENLYSYFRYDKDENYLLPLNKRVTFPFSSGTDDNYYEMNYNVDNVVFNHTNWGEAICYNKEDVTITDDADVTILLKDMLFGENVTNQLTNKAITTSLIKNDNDMVVITYEKFKTNNDTSSIGVYISKDTPIVFYSSEPKQFNGGDFSFVVGADDETFTAYSIENVGDFFLDIFTGDLVKDVSDTTDTVFGIVTQNAQIGIESDNIVEGENVTLFAIEEIEKYKYYKNNGDGKYNLVTEKDEFVTTDLYQLKKYNFGDK